MNPATPRKGARRRASIDEASMPPRGVDRVPSWGFLLAALGLPALLFLLALVSDWVRSRFTDPYLWRPIVHDEGYNPVNTAFFVVLIVLLALWAYRMAREQEAQITSRVLIGGLPLVLAGAGLRVLEDSDFFAPYGGARSCLPEAGLRWDTCLGTLFVNPILFALLAILLGAMARLAYQVRKIGRNDRLQGLRFYALTLVAGLSLYGALWAADPASLRFVPNPFLPLLGALIGLLAVVWQMRDGEAPEWGWCFLGYTLMVTLPVLHPILIWLGGGVDDWRPEAPTHAWILVAVILLPTLLCLGTWLAARPFAKPLRREKGKPVAARRSGLYLAYLVLLLGAFLFATGLAMQEFLELGRRELETFGYLLLGPFLVPLGAWISLRAVRSGMGTHPGFASWSQPVNLELLWSQYADAAMTGIALDVYGAEEKHVLPRGLIDWVRDHGLSPPLGTHPAATAMIPFKVLLVLLLVWVLDVRLREWFVGREQLSILIKVAVLGSALGPALRDALRIAMGV